MFWLTPLGRLASLGGLGLSTLGFVVFAFYFKKFPKPLRIFGILFAVLFVQSVFMPNYIYGQSYFEGLLSSTPLYVSGLGLLFYYVMIKYKIPITFVTRQITSIAWILFVLYVFFYFTDTTLTAGDDKVFGVQNFKKTSINLAAFIFLTKFFRFSNFRHLFYGVLLLTANHLGDFQRIVFFLSILCIGLLLYHFRRKTVGIQFLILL